MRILAKLFIKEPIFFVSIFTLIAISLVVLNSIAPNLFPQYYLYLILSFIVFFLFLRVNFEILSVFYWHFYFLSLILLILPLFLGQITRGAIRWIPIGPITIQPSEVVRPFLLLFFSVYVSKQELKIGNIFKLFILCAIPIILILIQPSLGVAVITGLGILGVILSSGIKIKKILLTVSVLATLVPVFWFMLAPYQRQRVDAFLNPGNDPRGAGYNSIQAMISVGSGRFFGRGLGKGIQTQLAFLPEKHTDFIFAAISEELGFLGAMIIIASIFAVLWRLTTFVNNTKSREGGSFLVGVFWVILTESIIHIGMNLGILPITGVPLPLVSAGGSALLSSMILLAISVTASGI